jgi:hypothetical protein
MQIGWLALVQILIICEPIWLKRFRDSPSYYDRTVIFLFSNSQVVRILLVIVES